MKPNFICRLTAPLSYIGIRIIASWASRMEPYPAALKDFGIRIVADKSNGSWDNHEEAYRALVLLNEYDEQRFALVKNSTQIIYLIRLYGSRSGYFKNEKMCVLDVQKFSASAPGTIPICIAGLLVYFASFAKFNVPLWKMTPEIKQHCDAEENAVMEKLRKILCE